METRDEVNLDPDTLAALSSEELMKAVSRYYEKVLFSTEPAQEFLRRRGLDNPDAWKALRLGFSNRSLGPKLPQTRTPAGGAVRERLIKLGLVKSSTGHEVMRGSLTVPVFAKDGQTIGMLYGRKVGKCLSGNPDFHLYTREEKRGVWNRDHLTASTPPLLTDSLMNGLTAFCAGLTNVTTTWGLGGFTKEMLEALQDTGTKQVVIAFRRTSESEVAAQAVTGRLKEEGIEALRMELPRGHDLNDYARSHPPGEESLRLLYARALGQEPPMDIDTPEPMTLGGGEEGGRSVDEDEPELPQVVSSPEPSSEVGETLPQPARPTASLQPAAPPAAPATPTDPGQSIEAKTLLDEEVVVIDDRRYRIRGLGANTSLGTLKVNVLASRGTEGRFHSDVLDLYQAKQRTAFTKAASVELGCDERVVKLDLGKVLLHLEALQEKALLAKLSPKSKTVVLSDSEKSEALELLQDPKLAERVVRDFERAGVVGEETNLLVTYLAATSRLLDSPLAVVVQSSSAAGKSNLVKSALSFIPEEARLSFSAMSAQSLFYFGATDLSHKILNIAEEEGAERASYGLKLLQSEGEVSIASTGKDASGRLMTETYQVRGPVSLLLTTTAIEVDPELMNRCLVLSVNEERSQTQAIHRLQRRMQTLEGLKDRADQEHIRRLHQNAQRLLSPMLVVNPFAPKLTFLDDRTRTRRDHMKYLGLISAIALLHQHQRPRKTAIVGDKEAEYIEVVPSDIELANRLVDQILGRSLDHMPPHTRRVLLAIDGWVAGQCESLGTLRKDLHFTRRELREGVGGGDTQLKVHLARLVELEYLLLRRKGHSFAYELLFDGRGEDGRTFLAGLLDPASLYEGSRADSGRATDGPKPGGGRTPPTAPSPNDSASLSPHRAGSTKIASRGSQSEATSYARNS